MNTGMILQRKVLIGKYFAFEMSTKKSPRFSRGDLSISEFFYNQIS